MKNSTTVNIDSKILAKQLKFSNHFEVPKISRAVVNVGVGSIVEKDARKKVAELITRIIGQKVVPTKAKKSVSAFKIRQGNTVGLKATLRGKRMYYFIDKLIQVALPRTRDFQGINKSAVTSSGISIGIKDITIFPEIKPDEVKETTGMQVNLVTQNKDKQALEDYFKAIGFPIEK